MATPTFAITATFEITVEHAADFRKRVMQQATDSLAKEADCHQFDVLSDPANPALFVLYETYTDAAAFDAHCQTPHFADFSETVGPWVVSKQVRRLTLLTG